MNAAMKQFFGSVGQAACSRLGTVADAHLDKLRRVLLAAGEPGEVQPVQLFGVQLVSMVLFPLIMGTVLYQIGFLDFLFEGPKQVLFYLALIAAGFLFPVKNVGERGPKRQES